MTVTFKSDIVGITPACAGKSAEILALLISEKDHPRMCGEKPPGLLTVCR